MHDFLRLTDLSKDDIYDIFHIADGLGEYRDFLKNKTAVMFFPTSSIRTRVTFEKGISLLGGETVLFPAETLDKREDHHDVFGYLDNWADVLIIRRKNIAELEKIAKISAAPVINAMTDINHPCEILSDLYALSKMGKDIENSRYLFCGTRGNIGLGWKEASEVVGFSLEQCCPAGYEMDGVKAYNNILDAIPGRDIICTDSLSAEVSQKFDDCRVTLDALRHTNEGAVLNPCPPFYRGEEVSEDAIASEYFAGYGFKKHLLEIQQAVMIWCMK